MNLRRVEETSPLLLSQSCQPNCVTAERFAVSRKVVPHVTVAEIHDRRARNPINMGSRGMHYQICHQSRTRKAIEEGHEKYYRIDTASPILRDSYHSASSTRFPPPRYETSLGCHPVRLETMRREPDSGTDRSNSSCTSADRRSSAVCPQPAPR